MTNSIHTHQTATQLSQLLQQRHEYLRVIFTLQQQQQELVSGQRLDELLTLLATRQQAFSAFEQRQEHIRTLNHLWPDIMDEQLSQLQQACRQLDQQTMVLMESVLAADDVMTRQMAGHRQETQRQLQAVSQAMTFDHNDSQSTPSSQFDFGCV